MSSSGPRMRSSTICNTRSGTEPAVAADDRGGRRQTFRFVAQQSPDNIAIGFGHGGRQRLRIKDCLRLTVGADRVHGMRGVPQQGDAPKAPALDWIAIDHRVFKDAFRAAEQRRKVDEAELPTGEVRQEILEPALM
jgi:hypothetical protein